MSQKTITGSEALAKQIKTRRNQLDLTIEEAASRAGLGTKTWSRYEAGESIRIDKCKGICKALNWKSLPEMSEDDYFSLTEYKNHEAWSSFLENRFGVKSAISFATGSDILLDYINEDMGELATMPSGTHIGQLNLSMLLDYLPKQFLMFYDYDFLYRMKCQLSIMRKRAILGQSMIAKSVIEELIIYLCEELATIITELEMDINEIDECSRDWVFDLFEDMDIVSYLYSDIYIESDHPYHISGWFNQQFYV